MTTDALEVLSQNMPLSLKISALEKHILSQPQSDVPSHFIQGGKVGAKTVFLKKGLLVIGSMHRFENMSIMSRGDILLVTDGPPCRYMVVDSPVILVAPPGTKRVLYVLEDAYWTSVLPTESKDLAEIEQQFLVPPEEQERFIKLLGLETI